MIYNRSKPDEHDSLKFAGIFLLFLVVLLPSVAVDGFPLYASNVKFTTSVANKIPYYYYSSPYDYMPVVLLFAKQEQSTEIDKERKNKKHRYSDTSSVDRLDFCFDRISLKKSTRDYLREVNEEDIPDKLMKLLREKASMAIKKGEMIPEEMFVAVLDAYIYIYQNHQRQIMKDNDWYETYQALMDTLDLMRKSDDCCNVNIDNTNMKRVDEKRTVDTYATVIHFLLSLSMDTKNPSLEDRERCAVHALNVLLEMESDPRVAISQNKELRLLQYNKVLKGLAVTESKYLDDNSGQECFTVVTLLDFMCLNYNKDGILKNNDNMNNKKKYFVCGFDKCLKADPDILPNAKSFATVMGNVNMIREYYLTFTWEGPDRFKNHVLEAKRLNVYEGYLKKQLLNLFNRNSRLERMEKTKENNSMQNFYLLLTILQKENVSNTN